MLDKEEEEEENTNSINKYQYMAITIENLQVANSVIDNGQQLKMIKATGREDVEDLTRIIREENRSSTRDVFSITYQGITYRVIPSYHGERYQGHDFGQYEDSYPDDELEWLLSFIVLEQ